MDAPAPSPEAASSALGPPPLHVVAEGRFTNTALDGNPYVFKFSTDLLRPCPFPGAPGAPVERPGTFTNEVKCRKWTDTSGQKANLGECPSPEDDPDPGRIINIGHVTLAGGVVGPQPIVVDNLRVEGIQTYGTEIYGPVEQTKRFTVFLFTLEGETANREKVTGAGKVLERLNPWQPDGTAKAPLPVWWRCAITVCPRAST